MSYTPTVTGGQFVNPNVFSAGDSQLLASTIYDLYPQEMTQLFERNQNGLGWRMLLKIMGFNRGVSAPTTGHYEIGRNIDTVAFGSIVSPSTGAGTNVVVALTAGSMYTVTTSAGSVATSYIRENDVIELKDADYTHAFVVAKNTTVSPHQVTLRPLDSAVDLAGKIATNSSYFIPYRLFGEGTDVGKGVQSRVIKYTNTFAIIKDANTATGSAMTTRTYFDPIPGMPGAMFMRNTEDMAVRHELLVDGALLFGKQANNLTATSPDLDYTVNVSSTEGLLTFLENYAYEQNIIPGLQSIQDFQDAARLMKLEVGIANTYLVAQGFDAYQGYENVFLDFGQKFDHKPFIVTSDIGEGETEAIQLNIGAYGIKTSGYDFRLKMMNAFNDGKGAATSGYPYLNYSVFLPVSYMMEKSTGTESPTFGYEYQALNGYNREHLFVRRDGTGADLPITSTIDVQKVGIVSEIASHCTCPNNCVLQTPA